MQQRHFAQLGYPQTRQSMADRIQKISVYSEMLSERESLSKVLRARVLVARIDQMDKEN